jgi:TonB family protein
MSNFFSKYLGKIALLAAAVLWAGCGESDKKADESAESQTVQEQSKKAFVDSVQKVVRDSSITSETISGTRGRLEPILDEDKGLGDSIVAGLLYGSGGGVMAETKGEVQVPQESDIVIEKGYNLDERSVLKTIRQRTPGLRHIYNKNLKKKPEFKGTVVLKLKVDEMGNVENIVLDSSTTGYEEFDEDIRRAVNRWKFEKKKVRGSFKIPFKFYEKN